MVEGLRLEKYFHPKQDASGKDAVYCHTVLYSAHRYLVEQWPAKFGTKPKIRGVSRVASTTNPLSTKRSQCSTLTRTGRDAQRWATVYMVNGTHVLKYHYKSYMTMFIAEFFCALPAGW